jgi:hypothetical protein
VLDVYRYDPCLVNKFLRVIAPCCVDILVDFPSYIAHNRKYRHLICYT